MRKNLTNKDIHKPFSAIKWGMALLLISIITASGLYWYGGFRSLDNAVAEGHAVLLDRQSGKILVGNTLDKTPAAEVGEKSPGDFPAEAGQPGNADAPAQVTPSTKPPEVATHPANEEDYCTKPMVALIVANVGLSKEALENALQLPKVVALGVVPYASDVNSLVSRANSLGFEVLLNLPMQPSNYPMNDPGPYALLNNLSVAENMKRLDWVLSRSSQIIGVYSSEDETYTNIVSNIAPVLGELKKRNLIFMYGGGANDDLLRRANQEIQGSVALVNVLLDKEVEIDAIRANLKKLEGVARAHGYAIGLIHSYPVTAQVLKEWMNGADNDDVLLVPLSKLIKSQSEAAQKEVKTAHPETPTAKEGTTAHSTSSVSKQ